MVVRVRAKLELEGGVDELRIAQIAEEVGAESDAVGVGQHAADEQGLVLGLGPSLDVLAGQDVADDPLRLLRHQTRRGIAATCEQGARSAQGREPSTRVVSCTARTGDGAARAGGGQRAVVKGSEQRAAGIRRAAEKQRQAGSEQEEGAAQTPWETPGRQVLWREP